MQVVDTGGSTSTETSAAAIVAACAEIKSKMTAIVEIFKKYNWPLGQGTFLDIAAGQNRARIALSAIASVRTFDPVPVSAQRRRLFGSLC